MITVFCGTNRPNSLTEIYAKRCFKFLNDKLGEEVKYFSLEDLPDEAILGSAYSAENQHAKLAEIQDEYLLNAEAFFIVSPEYNGSFPGVLKYFIDACSIREYQKTFSGKKVGLLGVSSGRAGNLRGIDHLSSIFNHMGSHVLPKAMPLGQANAALNAERKIADTEMLNTLDLYISRFLEFRGEKVGL